MMNASHDMNLFRMLVKDSSSKRITSPSEATKLFLLKEEISDQVVSSSAAFYDDRVAAYDENLHITFETHGVVEDDLRAELIKEIGPAGKVVLELAAGTGRDSVKLANTIGSSGALIAVDPSELMLRAAVQKLQAVETPVLLVQGAAECLPLKPNTVDAVYSFGGFNEFSDKAGAISEIVRVCKPGAKVLICDEGIPSWWRKTKFFEVLSQTNPQFNEHPPLEYLPVQARNTSLRWVNGETFWVLSFDVGQGAPTANFDIPIPGKKGGTLRTRYEGKVQGVTLETRSMLDSLIQSTQMSEHEIVDRALIDFISRFMSEQSNSD